MFNGTPRHQDYVSDPEHSPQRTSEMLEDRWGTRDSFGVTTDFSNLRINSDQTSGTFTSTNSSSNFYPIFQSERSSSGYYSTKSEGREHDLDGSEEEYPGSRLDSYIYESAYKTGLYSDVTVKAFGQTYHLHKLILARSPYFASLISGQWKNSDTDVYQLDLDNVRNASKETFEIIIARMYGSDYGEYYDRLDVEAEQDDDQQEATNTNMTAKEERESPGSASRRETEDTPLSKSGTSTGSKKKKNDSGIRWNDSWTTRAPCAMFKLLDLFAMADFFDLPWFVHEVVDDLVLFVDWDTTPELIRFCNSYVGNGDEILRLWEALRSFVCMKGPSLPQSWWLQLSPEMIDEVFQSDALLVTTETTRYRCIKSLYLMALNYCCPQNDQETMLNTLKRCLNDYVYYTHLAPASLLEIANNNRTENLISTQSLQQAAWQRFILEQTINDYDGLVAADMVDGSLGFLIDGAEKGGRTSSATTTTTTGVEGFLVPGHDATVDYYSSHPKALDKLSEKVKQSLSYSILPPFRFGVSFLNVSSIPVGVRFYGASHWYAGSFWNLYIQKITATKSHQLGVYLHRSVVKQKINADVLYAHDSSYTYAAEPMFDPDRLGKLDLPGDGKPEFLASERKGPVYDQYATDRHLVKAYFVMFTPARRTKTSLTCFSSTPDNFAESQSWGWKSYSLWKFVVENPSEPLQFVISLGMV